MLAIATIYSLCSLCGPNSVKCGRYNAHCNVPKEGDDFRENAQARFEKVEEGDGADGDGDEADGVLGVLRVLGIVDYGGL